MEDNWISVKEGLPQYGVRVWGYYYPIHPLMDGRTSGVVMRISPKQYKASRIDSNDFVNVSEVTHWMPLPNPPKV